MKAIHGGQAQTERIDAHKIAVLLRGGMLPQAYVDPAEMRATRHLLRRRMPLMRHRAGLRAPIPNTPSQYNLPQIGTKLAYKANRGGGAERLSEPAVQPSLAVDLTRIGSYARRRTALALELVTTAQGPGAQTVSRLRSSPGVGNILALVLLYASHDLHRFPRVQEVGSYGRLLKCAKESAGKRYGPAGAQIGTADRTGAFSEAAVLFWRNHPAGPKDLARLANTHGTGNAWTGLAPTRARAVDDMLRRAPAVDLDKFCSESGRGTREPDASLDAEGISLRNVLWQG
jgi:transposase